MCNLFSMTKGQQAIRELAGAMRDMTGNLPMLPGIFPGYAAPIVRSGADGALGIVARGNKLDGVGDNGPVTQ